MDEPTFMMHLDLELERARRHGRCFGLTRFEVDRIATRDTEIASRVVAQLRTCDVSTFVDDQLIVLWSESLPNEMPAAIERVVRTSAGSLRLAQSVAFPSSALTRTALLKDLMGRPPTIVPVQSAVDANVTSNGSDRLAG